MSHQPEDAAPPDAMVAREEARAQAAATRRRWLTLAEIVAIAGVVIAALTLWNNWQAREAEQQAQTAAAAAQANAARTGALVMLTGTPKDGGSRLMLTDAAHRVQSVTITFPKSLGVEPQSSALNPAIELSWFRTQLLDAASNGPAEQHGRLPVIVAADYWDGAAHRTDRAIYDIIWSMHDRLLRGRAIELQGLVLEQRHGVTPGALEKRWQRDKPAGK